MLRSSVLACFALPLVLSLPVVAQTPDTAGSQAVVQAPGVAYRNDPNFLATLKDAKALEHQRQYGFAVDTYKKAFKVSGNQCVECLQSMYKLQIGLGNYKDAIAVTNLIEGLTLTPNGKSVVEVQRGKAILAQGGDKPKPAQLEAAHTAFQQALASDPKNVTALFLDGKSLARMGKTDEARTEFKQCVDLCKPTDPARVRAQHFAEDPELSLHKMAPPFEVTALDGSKFNLDAMGGRVVLIDFWATWCGPCNAELPHMKKLAKDFAGQPLVIISVSWDADEDKWKQFIQKNEMTWVQYRDADHKLSEQFGIQAIPHYFTIDSDGILTAEILGSGSDVEGKLKKLIAKARTSQAASLAAPALSPTGN